MCNNYYQNKTPKAERRTEKHWHTIPLNISIRLRGPCRLTDKLSVLSEPRHVTPIGSHYLVAETSSVSSVFIKRGYLRSNAQNRHPFIYLPQMWHSGLNRASKINVGLGPGWGFKMWPVYNSGLQLKWTLLMRNLQLFHKVYKSVHLEVSTALCSDPKTFENTENFNCQVKQQIAIILLPPTPKISAGCGPDYGYAFLIPPHICARVLSCICVFLVSARYA